MNIFTDWIDDENKAWIRTILDADGNPIHEDNEPVLADIDDVRCW